jgi:hypothetical protein
MKSTKLNELSPETKMSAFKKAAAYTRKPGEITNKVLHNKRMSQAYTFEKHVSPQIQTQANAIAKLIGSEFIASIDKGIYGSEEIPAISIKFYEPTNKKSNAELLVSAGSGYNAGDISTDLKLNNIELSEPVQRKLLRFADAVYKSEITSDLKENYNTKRPMNKKILKTLIKECYKEVLAENDSAITKPLDDKIQKDPNFLKQLQDATKEAEKGNTTNLALLMMMKENEEAELPATRSVNMGDAPSKIDLGVNTKASSKISKLQSAIDQLSTTLKTNLDLYKAGQMSIADYKTAVGDIPVKLKSLVAALEAEIGKTANI